MTNIESLIAEALKRNPGKGSIVKINAEETKRAWEAWGASAKKIAPLLNNIRNDRIEALKKAKNVVIG